MPAFDDLVFYDKDSLPIDVHEWGKLHNDREYRFIARAKIMDRAKSEFDIVKNVSTVWIGINTNPYDYGPPMIFETAVFEETDQGDDVLTQRYATLKEALAGHTEAIVAISAMCEDPDVLDVDRTQF